MKNGNSAIRARRRARQNTASGSPNRTFPSETPFGMAGGTMARGEMRVLSPFILAGRLARGATGLSRSGGEGS